MGLLPNPATQVCGEVAARWPNGWVSCRFGAPWRSGEDKGRVEGDGEPAVVCRMQDVLLSQQKTRWLHDFTTASTTQSIHPLPLGFICAAFSLRHPTESPCWSPARPGGAQGRRLQSLQQLQHLCTATHTKGHKISVPAFPTVRPVNKPAQCAAALGRFSGGKKKKKRLQAMAELLRTPKDAGRGVDTLILPLFLAKEASCLPAAGFKLITFPSEQGGIKGAWPAGEPGSVFQLPPRR